ncbi:MAG: helix-turn-helix domain-containing protein [Candidatus Limnocylindria bacterium]
MSAHATPTLDALLTPGEVCAALRISRATFYRYVQSGDLRAVRLGGKAGSTIRIPAAELERLLAGNDPEED